MSNLPFGATGAPAPEPAFDAEAVFLREYLAAIESITALQLAAWQAMERAYGRELALALAPTLLLPLIDSAQSEAGVGLQHAITLRQQEQMRRLAADRPANPW